ncbi:MAG: class I SAM-dependent methyltransferase [Chitinophagales bacterium]|nr:class I SAM-dependent methyltransferase [Chitinophagales bacterium]
MNFFKNLFKRKPKEELTPQKVQSYYDEWTDRYMKVFGDTFQSFRTVDLPTLFDYIIAGSEMKDGQNVIDAGCGVCGPAIYFAKKMNVNIQAITISEYQSQIAQKNIQEAAPLKGKVDVRQGDFHHLDNYYLAESIDLIYFLEALTHSIDIPKVFENCYKVLKLGAKVYIKDLYYNEVDDKKMRKEVDIAVQNVNRDFFLHIENISVVKEAALQAGFRIKMCRPLQIPYYTEIGTQFVAENGITIHQSQKGLYDGTGPIFLIYYETLLEKI